MRVFSIVVAIVLSALAGPSFAAGFRFITIPADADGAAITGALWYPCTDPPGTLQLGPYLLPVTKDCPLSGGKHPLIVVSHGRGGNSLGHRDTAQALADAGFIVAAINHPGDTFTDQSRINELSVFVSRPNDIKRLVDYLVGPSPAASFIDPSRIGFFGFSRGGYTGLAVIGGNADWLNATAYCSDRPTHSCQQIRGKEFPAASIPHDPRIKAAVVADPLAIFFTGETLASIKVPVQLWVSELGGDGVFLRDTAPLDKALPGPHEFHVVRNAGHFAFFLCPPTLAKADPDICTDPSGFDRTVFHEEFNAAVVKFLQDELK
ncbi:MAG: dienelactone hydrolase [Alphaproteobacteria bacterium]|nr:dienelactone hydrolase [Alphaproteobacteria bacterium]